MRAQTLQAPGRNRRVRPDRGARLQPHVRDHDRPGEGVRLDRVPAAGDRAGDLHQLQERAPVLAQETAVRDRADRQVLPQRDHAGQLHLPHARVRADGDGVLRAAARRAEMVRALAGRARALVRRARHPPRPPPAQGPRRRRALPLLVRHLRRRIPVSHRLVGARGHRQPRRLRPHPARRILRREARVLRPGLRRALRPVCDRACGRRRPRPARVPRRRLRRGSRRARGHRRGREAHGAPAAPAARARQGRRPAAREQGRAARARQGGARRAASTSPLRVRRRRRDRQALPPPRRNRNTVLLYD